MAKRLLLAFLIAILVRVAPASAEGDYRPRSPPIPVPRYEYTEQNVQGMWWASPHGSEPGWGVHIAHQGSTLVLNLFIYDIDSTPLWLTGSNLGFDKYTGRHSGRLYRTTGPAFDETPWNTAKVRLTDVGSVFFTATGRDNAILEYTLNGVFYQKDVTRYDFAYPTLSCAWSSSTGAKRNYTDLWWHAPAGSESGWGVALTHQGDTLFATWYTYRADGKGEWLVMSDGAPQRNGSFSGSLDRTRGPPPHQGWWDASQISTEYVGTATFTFIDNDSGTFTYTRGGVTQSKAITRYRFSSPPTVCG